MEELPPPGADNASVIASYVAQLVEECDQDPRRIEWLAKAERNYNLYLGNHYETPAPADTFRVVLNRIQNCIVSLVAIQAGDPPQITFNPRESGDPPVSYLNTDKPEAAPFIAQLQAAGVDANDVLPPQVAESIRAQLEMAEQQQMEAAGAGLPPPAGLPPKDLLIDITDATASQALQTVFDAMWEESDGAFVFVENILNKNVLGWQPTLYEFDDLEKRHVLTNVHPKQVFVDALNVDNSRWHYAIYDQPVSADEARQKWPALASKLADRASEGALSFPAARTYDVASMYDQQFRRKMVVVRTAWIRFQPYPMDVQEATYHGLVEHRDVPEPDAAPPAPAPAADENEPTDVPPGEDRGEGGVEEAPPAGDENEATDNSTGETPMPEVPTRPAMFAPGTDTEVYPDHPEWPKRFGIRRIIIVEDEVVDDAECETIDIPLPSNRNLPIPYSPYGQGEPLRLEGLQMAINRCLTSVTTQQAYNAYPPELVPQSVVDRLDKALQKARSKPGARLVIPDELIIQLGDIKKIVQTLDTPPMPADTWRLLDLLISLIDKEGNQTEVMEGNAEAGWSGETVKALQNAASQVIRGKSLYTEFYLKRLARLMVHSITNRLTPDDWRRYVSRYPYQALQAMHDRVKSIDVDIKVEIKSGSGSARQSETTNLIQAQQAGIPISPQTIMERLNVDPEAEQQKRIEWARQEGALTPVANNPGAGGGAAGGQQPPTE